MQIWNKEISWLQYIYNNWVIESDVWYSKLQCSVIRFVLQHQNKSYTITIHLTNDSWLPKL
jgi:hypothetical protein